MLRVKVLMERLEVGVLSFSVVGQSIAPVVNGHSNRHPDRRVLVASSMNCVPHLHSRQHWHMFHGPESSPAHRHIHQRAPPTVSFCRTSMEVDCCPSTADGGKRDFAMLRLVPCMSHHRRLVWWIGSLERPASASLAKEVMEPRPDEWVLNTYIIGS